ncbi:MAG: choice-of-anchor B family protein [Planctomycetota bacterium]
MTSRAWCLVLAAAMTCGAVATLLSHPDDPKARVPREPYHGPGLVRKQSVPKHGSQDMAPQTFPAQGIELLSWLTLDDFGGMSSGNDCWGYVSPSGREYAIIGLSHGTGFVEITNPTQPTIVSVQSGPTSLWRDIKTYQTYAYAVSEGGGGIQVFDLSQIDSGVVTFVRNVTSGGTHSTHNVAIDEDSGYLYRLGGGSNGLRIYSLSNPSNPSYVSSWSKRYIHDAQIVTYTSGPYAGKQIVYACSGYNGGRDQTGLDVIDVTNKGNLIDVARRFYSSAAYSHQAWLSPDQQYLYLDDELDENGVLTTTTHVFDVSNPGNPQAINTFTNGNTAIGHNMYTKGQYIYQANYRSGLRIFDATDPVNPVEVASYDTWPEDDNDAFNGLWSVYPYFPSGVIIGSDLERGLFVWWHGAPRVGFEFVDGEPTTVDPAGQALTIRILEESPGLYQSGTAQLHVDTGSGWQASSLSSLGGDLYQATFPSSTCGSAVAYYFTAQATDGWIWTSPGPGALAPSILSSAVLETPILEEDFEIETSWDGHLDGDDAFDGKWSWWKPIGNAAQPRGDHTPGAGLRCFITGQDPIGGQVGLNDIDGGTTTLLSPAFDLSGYSDPAIGYWRWFSNDEGPNPSEDVLRVEISGDDGQSWTPVETVGPTGPQASGEWFYHQFKVSNFLTPTSQVRLRFIAADLGADSVVEAALDDLKIVDIACTGTRLDSVTPAKGSYVGGQTVTLSGSGFVSSPTLNVTFGGVPSQSVTVINSSTLQVTVPKFAGPGAQVAGGQGSIPSTNVDVTVTTDLGTDTLVDGYRYTGKR